MYMYTDIHVHTYRHTDIHMYIHTDIHMYIHTDIHMYIHTDIHMYIHTDVHMQHVCTLLMSLVKTPDAKPNSVWFALRMAPSVSLRMRGEAMCEFTQSYIQCVVCVCGGGGGPYPFSKMETIMTGPNDSSLAIIMWSSTLVKIAGSKKNPVCVWGGGGGGGGGLVSSTATTPPVL